MDNLIISTNLIEGMVDLKEKKIVQFSIPFSEGWTAYVDGKKLPIYRTDTMWMGLLLEKGRHNICLKYKTPLLAEGIIASLFAVGVLLLVNVKSYRKKPLIKTFS